MKKILYITAFFMILTSAQFSYATNSSFCNESSRSLNNSGTFNYMVFDLRQSSQSNGLIVWTFATTVNSQPANESEQFYIPFSHSAYEYLYAQLLIVQKNPQNYRLDFHKDENHVLCDLTVIKN